MRTHTIHRGIVPTLALLLFLATAAGCSTSTTRAPQPTAAAEGTLPIPAELVSDTNRALQIGKLLHRYDSAASQATDQTLAIFGKDLDPDVRGWVVTEDGARTIVTFVARKGSRTVPVYRTVFGANSARDAVSVATPEDRLTAEQASMFAARETASGISFEACSDKHNTVVLPASRLGQQGWLVYLIPATTTVGLVQIGGFQRVHVTGDGKTVLSVTPLSRGCLDIPPDAAPAGSTTFGAFLTDGLHEAPVESHVFLSLLHDKPMYVGNKRGRWKVTGDEIVYWGPWKEQREMQTR